MIIHAAFQRVLADGLRDVVSELQFALIRLLRNVGVGAEMTRRER